MSNNKVRIYDLSRELNLDNRDILGICEQLHIAVKSHSSTISEVDAERIREVALKNASRFKHRPRLEKPDPKAKSTPAPIPVTERKPQIVEVRLQKNRPVINAPVKPVAPVEEPLPTPTEEPKDMAAVVEPVVEAVEPVLEMPEPPDLKPAKPSAPTLVEKPVLKKKSTAVEESRSESRLDSRPKLAKTRTEAPVKVLPELVKPQRPTRDDGANPAAATADVLTPKPKRPALPTKPTGKKKSWDEEEEERESKKVVRQKRRAIDVFDEDEDDLEDWDDENETPAVMAMSIARPPKPKNLPGQPPSLQSAVAKVKKPVSKLERSKPEQRDRRPEKKNDQPAEMITITSNMTMRELASLMNVPETEIIKKLFFKGIAVNITQTLEVETAKMVAEEFGILVETTSKTTSATKAEMLDVADLDYLERRPPVVTIMGHVDHGKTTLLDAIRSTKVAQGEAGGITQHIGAYHVDVEHEGQIRQVVFLDTPGHEAFTAMRARGAKVTDIAVLVVAADDGVRPQTLEAIRHAQAAGVPIVVAINKIDKPEAQIDRVKQELTEYGLQPEEWGGNTIMVPVSAIRGENLDTLLEMILLVTDVEELVANPNRPAKGTVIEANLDKNRGAVATLLVQNGTLRVGDSLVAGSVYGKVRALTDDRGNPVKMATPSFAVEVLGLGGVPAAGEEFEVFPDEKLARAIADQRSAEQRESRLLQQMSSRRVTLNSLSAKAAEGELKELNLILKADVQGSVEAILSSIQQLPQNEVQIRVLLAAAGEITQADIDLAAASGAVVIGFNTSPTPTSRIAIDNLGVDVREYNIIYNLLDELQAVMEGLLEPEQVEEPLGQAEVRATFPVGKGVVAGCYILSGKAIRNCQVRVKRGGQVVYEGHLDSLKRMREDAKEVNTGYECGIGIDRFNDWQVGDIIETFRMVAKRRSLSPN